MFPTPVTWLGEQLSKLRVGGKQLRSRVPTESMPGPVVKLGFVILVILFFADEFLILAAVFGGPIAFAILAGFAVSVWYARNTKRGRRIKDGTARRARKLTTGRNSRRYGRRKED